MMDKACECYELRALPPSLQHLVERYQPSLLGAAYLHPIGEPPRAAASPGKGHIGALKSWLSLLWWSQSVGWQFEVKPAHFGLATAVKEPGGPVRAFDTYINSSIRLSIEQLKRLLENYQKM